MRLLTLLIAALAALVVCCVAAPAAVSGDAMDDARHYAVAVFSVSFDRPVVARRACESTVAPDQGGLTRLICARGAVFESFAWADVAHTTGRAQRGPPVYLVPLQGNAPLHPVYRLAATTARADDDKTLSFALLLGYHQPPNSTERDAGVQPETVRVLSAQEARSCRVRFLPPEQQIPQPAGQYWLPSISKSDSTKAAAATADAAEAEALVGDVAFAAAGNDEDDAAASGAALRKEQLDESVHVCARHMFGPRRVRPLPSQSSSQAAGSDDLEEWGAAEAHPCMFDPQRDGVFLDETSQSQEMAGIVNVVKGALSTAVSPMTDTIGGAMGDSIGAAMSVGFGGSFSPGLQQALDSSLNALLPAKISQILVPSLQLTLPGAISQRVCRMLSDYLENVLTTELAEAVTPPLTKELAATVPQSVVEQTTLKSTAGVSAALGHMLARSIPHAFVAALARTLARSPEHEARCALCASAGGTGPECDACRDDKNLQVHYALYYAGYYSSYYSDYYAQHFEQLAAQRLAEQERRTAAALKFRDLFEVLEKT